METTDDLELQLTPDELELLLETTTSDAPERHASPQSPQTSGDDKSSSVNATPMVGANHKRARRTEIEKLSRRRRQTMLREMRDQVQRLERQKTEMLEAARQAHDDHPNSAVMAIGTQLETLRKQFVQLSLDAQRLEREKTDLRRMLRARQLLSQSIQSLAAVFADNWNEPSWRREVGQHLYEPLPREELFRIMRESFEAITAYERRTDIVSSGNAFLGWVDHHCFQKDKGLFLSFTKRFPGRNHEQVMLMSWDIFSREELQRKMIVPNSAHVHLCVLHEPNDDVMVLHQHAKSIRVNKGIQTVYVLFRLRTDDGFTICFRTIPAPGIQDALDESDIWIDLFHWVHFKSIRDESTGDCVACEVVFGVAREGPFFDTIERILLDMFASVVRWENAAIAPMFLVAP